MSLLGCAPELTFEEPSSGLDIQNEDIGVVADVVVGDVVGSLDILEQADVVDTTDSTDAMLLGDAQDDSVFIDLISPGDIVENTDIQVMYDGGLPSEPDVAVEEDVSSPPCLPCDISCGDPCDGYPIRFNEVTQKGQKEIEIYNTTTFTWYLYGFSLGHGQSMSNDEEVYEFAQEDVLAPGEYFVIKKDNGHGLNLHDKDTLKLRSPDGELLTYVSWDRRKAKHSYCRIPDVSGPFQVCSEKTFGFPNQSN